MRNTAERRSALTTGTIILLSGASCSGKTSIARALQELMDEPSLHVGLDHFEAMQPRKQGKRIHVFYGQGIREKDLVHVMHQCVAAFASAGVNVVNEHIVLERRWLKDAVDRLSAYTVLFVGVCCPVEELERRERERERSNPSSGQAARQFHQLASLHAQDTYDLALDTSTLTPEECAIRIKRRLEEGAPPTAFRRLRDSLT
jgi:chloramphenicol 3-O phosphotransferase